MADDKTHRYGTEKTVILRPGGDVNRTTEAYNPHHGGQSGYGGDDAGSAQTRIIGAHGAPDRSGAAATMPLGSPTPTDGGPMRISPNVPGGGGQAGTPTHVQAQGPTQAQAPAGHDATRVLRPSVAPRSGEAPAAKSDVGLADGDLALLAKEGPVVGWLVVIGGAGKGLCRPLFYGNNSLGRDAGQRVPLNFGDDAISSTEQAYIRYDAHDRRFLLIPNLAKSNLVSVDDGRPTEPVPLSHGNLIGIGNSVLMFVPLCGPNFDWADVEAK